MNLYATIILVTLLLDFLVGATVEVLNLRALQKDVPEELKDVYKADAYATSQEYTRARTRFGLLTSTFDLVVFVGFWQLGGFAWLDGRLRQLDQGPVVTGLLFIGALVVGKGLIDLPFGVYSTFVLEERFGFNRTTARTYAVDLIKGLLLGVILGGPLLALILFFFERAGDLAWLVCWLLTTVFMLTVNFVFPTWILPLFNKLEPLEDGELRHALANYARSVSFDLEDIFVMDGSKRSSRSNAFFTGFGRHKRIALFDTLVAQQSTPELVAVLAHEVGHYKRRHIIKSLVLGVAHSGVVFFLLSIFLQHQGLFDAFYMENTSIYAGLVFFGLLYAPIEWLLSLFLNLQARRHEFEADAFAGQTADAGAMISALKKLSADNLSNLTPHPFYVFLRHSHPPVLQRIAHLRQWVNKPVETSPPMAP